MPSYTPPLRDMQFLLNELLQVPQALKELPAHSETGDHLIKNQSYSILIT